jgi:hypothetical protein
VAAAGGDEQAIKDGFLKSAGAVLVQGGQDKLKAYSQKAEDAYDTVQCISARDVDCLSNTTWARDVKGKILYDEKNGKPRIDPSSLDPNQYIGRWSALDPQSPEGKTNAFITQISKLPNMEAIPILKNQWVLTWTLSTEQDKKPTVVVTYVGKDAPFNSTVKYSGVFSGITVAYYAKPADGNRVLHALQRASIPYIQLAYVGAGHEKARTNALRCGPNTPVEAVKKVALALIDAGIDLKYIETKDRINPRQILILNALDEHFSTLNSPNLTRDQITGLSVCPSRLEN